MLNKDKFDKNKKLIGLDFEKFEQYCNGDEPSINIRNARLIPLLKTGDEGALSSIFLSSVRLIKEYRESIFKEIKFPRGGKAYFFTEVTFKDIDKSCRFDGLIVIVVSKKIKDVVAFEMKNKNNLLDKSQ